GCLRGVGCPPVVGAFSAPCAAPGPPGSGGGRALPLGGVAWSAGCLQVPFVEQPGVPGGEVGYGGAVVDRIRLADAAVQSELAFVSVALEDALADPLPGCRVVGVAGHGYPSPVRCLPPRVGWGWGVCVIAW